MCVRTALYSVYTAAMTSFAFARSEADGWSAIAKALAMDLALPPLPDGVTRLGFLYATDNVADDFATLVTFLRQTTGIEHWVGSIGMGICWGHQGAGGEAFGRPAAAVLIADMPTDSFSVLPLLGESVNEVPDDLLGWMANSTPPFGIVHGDPMNAAVTGLIEQLSLAMENATLEVPGFLVGGLTSSRGAHYQLAEDVLGGGLSGVLFAPDVEVATGLTQGCAPVGPAHRVTDCMDNVIMTLNGESALNVFKDDIGELLARDMNRVAGYIHAAFPVEGSDTGDYVVRNLVGVDPERGWLGVGGDVQTGDRVLFVRRDPASAEEDLKRMVNNLVGRLPGPAKGGLYFSCVARGPSLFGAEGREMEIVQEALDDVPIVGFFGQGEISNNRLYGYTGVLALFF